MARYTVKEVARLSGVSVRALHLLGGLRAPGGLRAENPWAGRPRTSLLLGDALINRWLILPALAALCALAGASAGPGGVVTPWAPANVSSDQFESHGAFDPMNRDFYFVRSKPDFTGWRILVSQCGATGYAPPRPAAFAGDGVEADPVFDRAGGRLYFISTRSTDGVRKKDLDIWYVERDRRGSWGTPIRMPAPVNSPGEEWFPRPGPDGWLYFGSDRPGGLGKTDIWRARREGGGRWTIDNAGPGINTAGDEYESLPSRDGKSMIVMASDGLYESRRQGDRWGPKAKLGPPVTVSGTEIGAAASPSGCSVLFSRATGTPRSGEFFLWRRGRTEAWPPACPAGRRPP
ncbi:MAG: PD40 domain-containing protein [Caulobacteraceae bacterium]|nr:PD40 domain-containing protein [Caulobacteraceae bacterium]